MLRRDFLYVVGSLLLPWRAILGKVKPEKKSDEYAHPVLGRLLSHECETGPVSYHEVLWRGEYRRFAMFPLERTLYLRFEHATIDLRNFNCSNDLVGRINRMSAAEVVACIDERLMADGADAMVVFDDEVSVAAEMCQGYGGDKRVPGKQSRFVVTAVSCTQTEQSETILRRYWGG